MTTSTVPVQWQTAPVNEHPHSLAILLDPFGPISISSERQNQTSISRTNDLLPTAKYKLSPRNFFGRDEKKKTGEI